MENNSIQRLESAVSRLESAVARLLSLSGGLSSPPSSGNAAVDPSKAFIIDRVLNAGAQVEDVTKVFERVFCGQNEFLIQTKQSQGSVPTISIDGGCQLYPSNDSVGASKAAAKSGEIDVLVPGADAEDDWVYLSNDFKASITTAKSAEISVMVTGGDAEDDLDVKPVKEETVSTLANSVSAKFVSAVPAESESSLDGKHVTEDEIRAVLMHGPVTKQDLLMTFKSRLKSQEAKNALAVIMRRISKIQVTEGGRRCVVLRV